MSMNILTSHSRVLTRKQRQTHVTRRIFCRICWYLLTLASLGLGTVVPSVAAGGDRAAVAEQMLAGIDQATWVEEGKSPHVVYIFFDPNCPYCHRVYLQTRDWIKHNAMELRWIPVGVLTATSPGKAAAILDAKDPLQAFYYSENHYSGGGAISENLGTDETDKALKINTDLLQLAGYGAVPTLLFRARDGKAILIQGAPPANKLKLIRQYVK